MRQGGLVGGAALSERLIAKVWSAKVRQKPVRGIGPVAHYAAALSLRSTKRHLLRSKG